MTLLEQWEMLEETWDRFSNVSSYDFQVGSFSIELNFATPLLEKKITKAFDHLKSEGKNQRDLTIYIWDTSQPNGKIPILDWNLIQQNGYRGSWMYPFYFHYFESIQALSILNMEENKAYYIVRDAESLPWWVSGSPLQVILHAWFQEKGMQLTHTAAISLGDKALLLSGKGGSGKSTTTLACIEDGLNYIAEDYSVLAPGEIPQVYSIYQSAKWKPHTRKIFPTYERFIANPETADREKALIYYQDIFPGQIKKAAKVQGILSLEVGQEESPVLIQSDLNTTLKNLLMSTVLQLPFSHARTLPLLQNVASKVPHYHLILGRDLKANVEVIRGLL